MIEVRKISKEDIVTVVQIHQDAFDGFFLTELGSDFLKLYYESVAGLENEPEKGIRCDKCFEFTYIGYNS